MANTLDPITKAATENLAVVADMKDFTKKLRRDFETNKESVNGQLSRLCTAHEMRQRIGQTEARQHKENRDLWNDI